MPEPVDASAPPTAEPAPLPEADAPSSAPPEAATAPPAPGNERLVEYEQTLEQFRYFHDLRNKIFGFFSLINGALITIVFSRSGAHGHEPILIVFALVFTLVMYWGELRYNSIADQLRKIAASLEPGLGISSVTRFNAYVRQTRLLSIRVAFSILYLLVASLWAVMLARVVRQFTCCG